MASARVMGTYVIPEASHKFHHLHPDANLHIKVGGSSEVLQIVVNEEVRLGLARFTQHPDVDALHLYDEEAVLVVHPEHLFPRTQAAAMAQVAQEPLIVYGPGDPGSSYFQFINRVCRDVGVTPKVDMNLDSVEAAKNMLQLGLGISFLPRSGARRELDSGSLSLIASAENTVGLLPDYAFGGVASIVQQ